VTHKVLRKAQTSIGEFFIFMLAFLMNQTDGTLSIHMGIHLRIQNPAGD
jgi:hypothetical protein